MRRDEQFQVDTGTTVDIELTAGTVAIREGAPNRVAVSIDSTAADAFDITCAGALVVVREGRPRRSARIDVDVPPGTDVMVRSASADVQARGSLGAVRVRGASSDVTVERVARLEVAVTSGDVRADEVVGDAQIGATSGDARLRRVGGRLDATLVSGDVDVDHLGGDLDADSASGDVTVRRCEGTSIVARSQSGDLRIGLPSGIRVEPELSTLSGRVVVPRGAPDGSVTGDRRLVRVRLRTTSGDVTIERAR